ncbi:MAG: biopolymer transporter ExbD [Bacteroidetes bacterium]|jgi:biopolymer transport protein ExbD|nr:biopolymer transporter ExbD [Bacteroidota bacterium]HQW45472.1 biopolymer transporter ExbD [Chitinophagaceae bacterium]MBK6821275.1 biopolymer transporter ExbD [Bacteroidota bacterium]MBK7586944.1 biopolymer transporter ExbD [Bacteroidota bacterium]MBK8330393.1 biopolymer transporter ExbD [Bacteroidota bacterium]
MSKHKLPRKSTHIDMTAMCDVAFLLLTFFMLATKFKPDEPVVVKTPSSTSDIILPDNSILLTVDAKGQVFFDYDNKKAKKALINTVSQEKGLNLTEEEKAAFVNGASFGLPFNQMKQYLSIPPMEQKSYAFTGIPVDTSYVAATNELGYWIQAARTAGQDEGHPPRICIKCDASTVYPKVKDVIKTLTKNNIDRFNLLTSLEAVPEGTDLFKERSKQ